MHTVSYKFQIDQLVYFIDRDDMELLSGTIQQISIEKWDAGDVVVSTTNYGIRVTTGRKCSEYVEVHENDTFATISEVALELQTIVENP